MNTIKINLKLILLIENVELFMPSLLYENSPSHEDGVNVEYLASRQKVIEIWMLLDP